MRISTYSTVPVTGSGVIARIAFAVSIAAKQSGEQDAAASSLIATKLAHEDRAVAWLVPTRPNGTRRQIVWSGAAHLASILTPTNAGAARRRGSGTGDYSACADWEISTEGVNLRAPKTMSDRAWQAEPRSSLSAKRRSAGVAMTHPLCAAHARILLIEDEQGFLVELSRVLDAAGYACHGASAAAAKQLAAEVHPDLIIADVNLTGTSGLSLCEEIKRQQGLAEVPVMFLSGAQGPDIVRRSHAAGGAYYLRKALDPQVILELIEKLLCLPALAGSHLA